MKFKISEQVRQLLLWILLIAILGTTVLATVRLIGTNANTIFSQVGSSTR